MLTANIQPTGYLGDTCHKIFGKVNYYDLEATNCELYFKFINSEGSAYAIETWIVEPSEALNNWGTDDTYVFNLYLSGKNFELISYE